MHKDIQKKVGGQYKQTTYTGRNLGAIGMVRTHRVTKDGELTELRYFITSLKDVKLSAKTMRSH